MRDDPHRTLVDQATHGDGRALDELLAYHIPQLVAYVRLHAGPQLQLRESCADIAQSVCREVLGRLDAGFEYRGEAPFRKWLFQAALNKIRDRHRYWNAERRAAAREQALAGDDRSGLRELCASFCSPSQVAIRDEDLDRLEAAFQELGEDQRQVITMSRLLGYDHAQIAAELGRSEGATRVLLHRSLARLGRLMLAGEDAN